MLIKTARLLCLCLAGLSALHAGDQEDVQQLVKDHTQFAFSLYPKLSPTSPNFAFSPCNIATTLSMVAIGARGETENELLRTLYLSAGRKSLAKSTFLLSQSLLPKKSDLGAYDLNIANALWVDRATFLLADFRYAIEQQLKGKVALVNFAEPKNAADAINAWTLQETKGKIKELISADELNPLTRLVLTSAVFFQGTWRNPFDPKNNEMLPFFHSPDVSSTAPMLKQTNLFPYFENDLVQIAALPFLGSTQDDGTIAYVMALPKSAENFETMLQEIPSHFSEWIQSLKMERLALTIPKFKFSNRFHLNRALQNLGVESAFTSSANFSGIDGMRDLLLSNVFHETVFDLDENGITAAAATYASISIKSALAETPPVPFLANHPFLFFIVDLKSQEILFLGQYAQVSDSQRVGSNEVEPSAVSENSLGLSGNSTRADIAISDKPE